MAAISFAFLVTLLTFGCVAATITQLKPIGGSQKDTWSPAWSYKGLYDGTLSTSVWDNGCYHSAGDGGWVEVWLPEEAVVERVEVLNRGDCCAERAIGMKVLVCGDDDSCSLCDVIKEGTSGAWLTAKCPIGLTGSVVRFEHHTQALQICEARVWGTLVPEAVSVGQYGEGLAGYQEFALSRGLPEEFIGQLPSPQSLHPVGGAMKDTWNPEWTYGDLYDGSVSTSVWDNGCYHSETPVDNWVEVTLDGVHAVTEVNVLNRGDCCAERALGMQVEVCMSHTSTCKTCGFVATSEAGEWLRVTCAGGLVIGDKVRFVHESDYIQICEVDVQGFPVHTGNGELPWWLMIVSPELYNQLSTEKVIMPVGGAMKDTWNPEWTYGDLYDGSVSTSVWDNGCYHSETPVDNWVEVYLESPMEVTKVDVLNRGDCCESRAIGMKVLVCDFNECSLCGTISVAPSGAWMPVECATPLYGERVRFEHEGDYIQICEARVHARHFGFNQGLPWYMPFVAKALGLKEISKTGSGAIESITPVGGSQSGTWSDRADWGYNKMYDGSVSTSVWDNGCFHSRSTLNPWVTLELGQEYSVTEVSVLNRGDCCSERAIGMTIDVCGDDGCTLCGEVTELTPGGWLNITCPRPLVGSSVTFRHRDQYLQICEVDIRGSGDVQDLSSPLPWWLPLYLGSFAQEAHDAAQVLIPVSGAESGVLGGMNWGSYRLYDHNLDTDVFKDGCFHSSYSADPWVQLDLASPSEITSIRLLNRGDCCSDRILGLRVLVCTLSSCQPCDTVTTDAPGQWVTVQCPAGVVGDRIRFEHSNEYIQICEVEIMGFNPPKWTFDKIVPTNQVPILAPTDPSTDHHSMVAQFTG